MYLFEHKDFKELIEQTAKILKMPVAFVEKDYWISYTLYRLQKAGVNDFIFKGGTSLTKGWNLLERFSEDIDLLFTPHTLTKEQKKVRLKKIKELVLSFEGLTFDDKESTSKGHFRTDCYTYEMQDKAGIGPLLPFIKLEMGYRGGDHPIEMRSIQSYVGAQLAKAGHSSFAEDVPAFGVNVLDHKRTFIEKTYAIHAAYENTEVVKYFRHYYDIFKLLQMADVQSFLGTKEHQELKTHVQEMSREFFGAKFPDEFELAKSLAFEASDDLLKLLDKAISDGKGLFFVQPPNAKEIFAEISKVRNKL